MWFPVAVRWFRLRTAISDLPLPYLIFNRGRINHSKTYLILLTHRLINPFLHIFHLFLVFRPLLRGAFKHAQNILQVQLCWTAEISEKQIAHLFQLLQNLAGRRTQSFKVNTHGFNVHLDKKIVYQPNYSFLTTLWIIKKTTTFFVKNFAKCWSTYHMRKLTHLYHPIIWYKYTSLRMWYVILYNQNCHICCF